MKLCIKCHEPGEFYAKNTVNTCKKCIAADNKRRLEKRKARMAIDSEYRREFRAKRNAYDKQRKEKENELRERDGLQADPKRGESDQG